jgi:hypothetical protein
MVLYFEDPKNSTQKLIDTITATAKWQDTKINLQKSLAFLYPNNEQIEERIYGNNSIYNSLKKKKIKYLRVNLTKDVNDLYKEDYKPLKKEIKDDYRRWKALLCSMDW